MPCRDDVVNVVLLLLLLLLVDAGLSSPLDYCHRLDAHPPRLYATKTTYEQVRARDLEPRQVLVDTDERRSTSSKSDVSTATQFAATDDYSCQRQYRPREIVALCCRFMQLHALDN